MTFALAAPVLIAGTGIAVDMAMLSMKRADLQSIADQAAIVAANELILGRTDKSTALSVVEAYKKSVVADSSREIKPSVALGSDKTSVTVELREDWTPFFAHFLNAGVTPVVTSATAALVGETNVCVLALESAAAQAVLMDNSAAMDATGCVVQSNSVHAKGIVLKAKSQINSQLVCSAGGIDDKNKSTALNGKTDCPAIADPLVARPSPEISACDHNNYEVGSGVHSVSPGTYCGGLKITNAATVEFQPGTYVIKDGNFEISGTARVTGRDVGFFLTGADAAIKFDGDAEINLSGAESGSLAGLLFYGSAQDKASATHLIRATKVRELTGTIYFPQGELRVDPNASVGEESAYTAIVVKSLRVEKGPRLVLNTDYDDTKVPVPSGIRTSTQVVLSQ
jgi:Flp pilus assembly protein TadG